MKETLRWYGEWVYEVLLSIGRVAQTLIRLDNKSAEKRAIRGNPAKGCSYCAALLDRDAQVCQFCGAIL